MRSELSQNVPICPNLSIGIPPEASSKSKTIWMTCGQLQHLLALPSIVHDPRLRSQLFNLQIVSRTFCVASAVTRVYIDFFAEIAVTPTQKTHVTRPMRTLPKKHSHDGNTSKNSARGQSPRDSWRSSRSALSFPWPAYASSNTRRYLGHTLSLAHTPNSLRPRFSPMQESATQKFPYENCQNCR